MESGKNPSFFDKFVGFCYVADPHGEAAGTPYGNAMDKAAKILNYLAGLEDDEIIQQVNEWREVLNGSKRRKTQSN